MALHQCEEGKKACESHLAEYADRTSKAKATINIHSEPATMERHMGRGSVKSAYPASRK